MYSSHHVTHSLFLLLFQLCSDNQWFSFSRKRSGGAVFNNSSADFWHMRQRWMSWVTLYSILALTVFIKVLFCIYHLCQVVFKLQLFVFVWVRQWGRWRTHTCNTLIMGISLLVDVWHCCHCWALNLLARLLIFQWCHQWQEKLVWCSVSVPVSNGAWLAQLWPVDSDVSCIVALSLPLDTWKFYGKSCCALLQYCVASCWSDCKVQQKPQSSACVIPMEWPLSHLYRYSITCVDFGRTNPFAWRTKNLIYGFVDIVKVALQEDSMDNEHLTVEN